jgi:nucleotide-binding universal stress UspA family protein
MLKFSIPAAPELGIRASHAAPVIVASDGRAQSDGALTVGRMLAGSSDALRLVSVVKPLPMLPEASATLNPDIVAARRAEARREVAEQARRLWDDDTAVELMEGDPATAVARTAHRDGATMIVCGLGRHRVADRIFGDETALRFIRMADVPVLAVAENLNHAPRRIVVAVDFTETSLRAARLSLEIAAPGASIYLVHVAPRNGFAHEWDYGNGGYKQDAGNALSRVHEQLRVPRGMTVQEILLQGDPATELLALASSVNADLIATGSHGRGFVARMLVGSVTTRIVRCSICSVLSVPYGAAMTRLRTVAQSPFVETLSEGKWAEELADFSRRNTGRRGTLEIDDPEVDAQAQAFDFPFAGADWDHNDKLVEIMVGDAAKTGRHLTHSVSGVTSIVVMKDQHGRDLALRVAHGAGGLTLFTFANN